MSTNLKKTTLSILLLSTLVLAGCGVERIEKTAIKIPNEFQRNSCHELGDSTGIVRCENNEVVCYGESSIGGEIAKEVDCKRK